MEIGPNAMSAVSKKAFVFREIVRDKPDRKKTAAVIHGGGEPTRRRRNQEPNTTRPSSPQLGGRRTGTRVHQRDVSYRNTPGFDV